jgi:hypothetical protein
MYIDWNIFLRPKGMTSHLFSICAMFGEVMVIFKYHKVLSISTKILLLCEVEFMNIGNL